jgi:8-oxo-dGTP pyrophosphatase MutT (NUDIX family)
MSEPPGWLGPLLRSVGSASAADFLRVGAPPAPAGGGRRSAVLILFGSGPDGPDLLLIERSAGLRKHAGQPAFPGGAMDPGDDGPEGTALRESAEEVGLDASGVQVVALLPELFLPPTGFLVTPVLAWWHTPAPVGVVDPDEVARVERVPVAELADPANRCRVRGPSGYAGPAFLVRGMVVWGFTAAVLDRVLELGGWARPWDPDDVRDLPARALDLARRGVPPGYAGPRGGPEFAGSADPRLGASPDPRPAVSADARLTVSADPRLAVSADASSDPDPDPDPDDGPAAEDVVPAGSGGGPAVGGAVPAGPDERPAAEGVVPAGSGDGPAAEDVLPATS